MSLAHKFRIRIIQESDLGDSPTFRILDHDGRLTQNYDFDPSLVLKMYESMVFARVFDEKTINLSTLREIGVYAPHTGQEATQVGSVFALNRDDWLVPMYRDSAAMIAKGMPPEKILQHLSGDEFGMQVPSGLNMLPPAISVATQIPHGAGLALSLKLQKKDNIVYASIGEGGTSKADFHEGLNFAGALGAPLIVGIQNNHYAISTQNSKETAAKTFAQKAIAYGIEGILVDGNDVLAVYEATKYAAERTRESKKPILLEFSTYRLRMHTTAELVSARKRDPKEVEIWKAKDPILRFEKFLVDGGLVSGNYRQEVLERAQQKMRDAVESFRQIPSPEPSNMFRYTYSKLPARLLDQLRESGLGEGVSESEPPQNLPKGGPQLNIRNSVNRALDQIMEKNDKVVVYGEDVGYNGGVFQVTKGLQEKYGVDRVFDSPLAELGIAGVFVGLSIGGLIPVAEIQFDGFTPPAFDQLITHIGRMRNRSRGRFVVRGVIRFPYGGGASGLEHHSDSPEVYLAATPGLKVVVPSDPFEAKGLLVSAVKEEDPVIFMEPKKLYDSPKIEVPEEEYEIPIGKAKLVKEGNDLTIVSYGYMLHQVIEAASNYSADVIDLRTLSPLDIDTIAQSVEKTGRLVIVHEAQRMCGIGAEIAAEISDRCLTSLKAPIKRVTGYDIIPPLGKLEKYYLPDISRITKAIRAVLEY